MDEHYIYGIIGSPLTHSFSKEYFLNKFRKEGIADSEYRNFQINSISELPELVDSHPQLMGLNVTIPYKEEVLPFLNEIHPEAKEIGAVNTIKITRERSSFKMTGYNTDAYGFSSSLLSEWKAEKHMKALILGSGGASKAVYFALHKMGFEIFVISRTKNKEGHLAYSDLTEAFMNEIQLVVNTTPLGMFPNKEKLPPIPYQFLGREHILFDLIYNPAKTLFLTRGEEQGAKIINGLQMLHLQAERSWSIWNAGL